MLPPGEMPAHSLLRTPELDPLRKSSHLNSRESISERERERERETPPASSLEERLTFSLDMGTSIDLSLFVLTEFPEARSV